MNALFSIYLALLEPGDEVLLPTPGFPNMDEMVRLLGGVPVFYRLDREQRIPPVARASWSRSSRRGRRRSSRTRPGNPTGAVFPAETVRGLAELAAERGVWLISDEVYDELILDDLPHVSAAALVPDAPVVSVYSFSKVYAMTGWRLGYCAAPPRLADVLRKLQEPQVSCPSRDLAACRRGGAARAARRVRRDARRLPRAPRPGRRGRAPRTASTCSAPRAPSTCSSTSRRSGSAARDVHAAAARRVGVAVAPGEVFGPGGEGLVRISFARRGRTCSSRGSRLARAIETFAA